MHRAGHDRGEDRDESRPSARTRAAPDRVDLASAMLQAQRTVGNRAVARAIEGRAKGPVLQRIDFWSGISKFFTGSYTVTIGSERVSVRDEGEEHEAARFIHDLKRIYGVEVSSLRSVTAVRQHHRQAPLAVREGVTTSTWQFRELDALRRALGHFAPILGERRQFSTRWDRPQELDSAGKATKGIMWNAARINAGLETPSSAALSQDILGEYTDAGSSLTMYEAGETSTGEFQNNARRLEATAVHEIAHGLMRYALPEFIEATGYWTDPFTRSGKAGAEAPPTVYGDSNAHEDLSETVMLYFVDRWRLLNGGRGGRPGLPGNPCPRRHALIERLVRKWMPEVAALELPAAGAGAEAV